MLPGCDALEEGDDFGKIGGRGVLLVIVHTPAMQWRQDIMCFFFVYPSARCRHECRARRNWVYGRFRIFREFHFHRLNTHFSLCTQLCWTGSHANASWWLWRWGARRKWAVESSNKWHQACLDGMESCIKVNVIWMYERLFFETTFFDNANNIVAFICTKCYRLFKWR